MLMTDELGRALRTARKLRKVRLQDVADAAGVSTAAVGQWESGATSPSRDNLIKAASFLRIDVAAAAKGEVIEIASGSPLPAKDVAPNAVLARDAPSPIAIASGERNVPCFGTVVGGPEGDFVLNGEISEYVPRPPGVASVRNLYALHVQNDSMSPRFEHGELVYVNPNREPAIGDDVVIELHGDDNDTAGPGYIKRLKARTSTKLICEQFNPPGDIEFERIRVKRFHRVIPWREVVGY